MAEKKKIRIHNRGKRDYTLLPSPGKKKNRMLPSGRAIDIEEDYAKKLLRDYPFDLIEFDSLVTGDKKDLSKEVDRLEEENAGLLAKLEKLEAKNQALTDKKSSKGGKDVKTS